MPEDEGFRSIGKRPFGRNTCFLCRCELTSLNRSGEHVWEGSGRGQTNFQFFSPGAAYAFAL
jgi:hypothetical protein